MGSRKNNFTFWRETRWSIMNRFLFAKHARIAPLWAAARSPAGFVARSSRTAPGTHRRSRLASGPGGLQQNAKLFLREP